MTPHETGLALEFTERTCCRHACRAPLGLLVNQQSLVLVCARVGNFQNHPQ